MMERTLSDPVPRVLVKEKIAEKGVELKVVSEADLGMGPTKVETELSNYQLVDGILVPMSIRQNAATGPVSIAVDKVEFNVAVDDAFFKFPKK